MLYQPSISLVYFSVENGGYSSGYKVSFLQGCFPWFLGKEAIVVNSNQGADIHLYGRLDFCLLSMLLWIYIHSDL